MNEEIIKNITTIKDIYRKYLVMQIIELQESYSSFLKFLLRRNAMAKDYLVNIIASSKNILKTLRAVSTKKIIKDVKKIEKKIKKFEIFCINNAQNFNMNLKGDDIKDIEELINDIMSLLNKSKIAKFLIELPSPAEEIEMAKLEAYIPKEK